MTERNDTPTGTSAADHLTDAELEAIARGQGLPDRETLEQRRSAIEAKLYKTSSVVGAATLAVRDLDGGEGSDVDGCLQVISELLGDVLSDLDIVNLLAPAEAQEVGHG